MKTAPWSELEEGQVILALRSVLAHAPSAGLVRAGGEVCWLGVSRLSLSRACRDGSRVQVLAELGAGATLKDARRVVREMETVSRNALVGVLRTRLKV